MPSFNRVMLIGHLTRDPELRYTPGNAPVVNFGLAVNRKWKDRSTGEQKEEVAFVDCACFGRTAEVVNQYMAKGRPLFVEGRLKFSQWETDDGQKRSKLSVVAEAVQFLGSKGGEQSTSYDEDPITSADVNF